MQKGDKPGLSLNNIIEYGKFSRIDNEIDEKNQRVQRLIELHNFNWWVSYLAPLIFLIVLRLVSPTYWANFSSHKTSYGLLTTKLGF